MAFQVANTTNRTNNKSYLTRGTGQEAWVATKSCRINWQMQETQGKQVWNEQLEVSGITHKKLIGDNYSMCGGQSWNGKSRQGKFICTISQLHEHLIIVLISSSSSSPAQQYDKVPLRNHSSFFLCQWDRKVVTKKWNLANFVLLVSMPKERSRREKREEKK